MNIRKLLALVLTFAICVHAQVVTPIEDGGTGASTAAGARANLGLDQINNTSDANKPISTATQVALDAKAPLNSPALTGTPTAPTAATGTATTQLATTAFTQAELARIANGRAPQQGLVFDGTGPANLTGVSAFGTGDFAVVVLGSASALTANSAMVGGAVGAFTLRINASGNVRTGKVSTSDAAYSTFAIGTNRRFVATYRRASGQGYLGLNGSEEAAIADAVDYSAPVSLIGARTGSFDPWAGFLRVLIFNCSIAQDDISYIYETGSVPAKYFNSASNTPINTSPFTDGDYGTFTASGNTGMTAANSSGVHFAVLKSGLAIAPGQKVRITGSMTRNSGKTPFPRFYFSGQSSSAVSLAADGAFDITLTSTANSASESVWVVTTGDANYTLSSVAITRLGLLAAFDPQALGQGTSWQPCPGVLCGPLTWTTGVSWALPWSGTLAGPVTVAGGTVNFGGTTSAYPRLNNNGNELWSVLADGSDFSGFKAKNGTFTGNLSVSGTGKHSFAKAVYASGGYTSGPVAGEAMVAGQANEGATICGTGAVNDVTLWNKTGAAALSVPTGTTNIAVVGTLTVGGASAVKAIRTATASPNFGVIAAGATASQTVTITGAAVGDTVRVNTSDGSLFSNSGVLIPDATVTGANTVTVTVTNPTGAGINLGTKPLRVTVISF